METSLEQKVVTPQGSPVGLKEQAVEVTVFLFLIVPSMIFSFFALKQGMLNFVLMASGIVLRDLALMNLIFYFLWRNREAIGAVGWKFERAGREMLLGVALFIPFFIGTGMLGALLRDVGLSVPSTPPSAFLPGKNAGEMFLAVILVLVVAIAEETIFRGYLLLRFTALTRRPALALLLSTVIFSLGHGYEGSAGVVTVGAMGLIFGLIYFWRGSLIAPMVMHFLQDLLAIFVFLFTK